MEHLPCDGTPFVLVWLVLGAYLLAYGAVPYIPESRLVLLLLLGPPVALAQLAVLEPGVGCLEAWGWISLTAFFTWFLNTAALFLGVVGSACGVAAFACTTNPDLVMPAALIAAFFAAGVYHKHECWLWEWVLPVVLGSWLLTASVLPMVEAEPVCQRLMYGGVFLALVALGAAGQWYRYKQLPPEIIQSLSTGELGKRYRLLNAVQEATGDMKVDVRPMRDQAGSVLAGDDAKVDLDALTEEERKIVEICKKYPDEMERIVYGGGIY
jgi:hypothetical protein